MKQAAIVIVALSILAAAAVVVVAARLDASELGRRLVDDASRSTGVEMTVEDFELGLFRGLTLRRVTVRGEVEAGRFEGTVDRIVVEPEMLALLFGELAVAKLVIEGPDVTVHVRGGRPPAPAAPGERPGGRRGGGGGARENPDTTVASDERRPVHVAELRVHDGILAVHNPRGQESIRIAGLELVARQLDRDTTAGASLESLDASGTVAAASLVTDRVELEALSGAFSAREGRLELTDMVATHSAGALEIHRLDTDLGQRRGAFHFVATIHDIDLATLLASDGATEVGTAQLRLAGEGPLASPDRLTARGSIELASGRLPTIAALAEIDATLGTRLDGGRYEATQIDFERRPAGHIDLAPFELVSESFSIRGEGRIRADDTLLVEARVGLDPERVTDLSLARAALAALATEDGRTWVPVSVSGPVSDPTVEVDRGLLVDELEGTARRALEEGIEKVKERLGPELGEELEQRLQRELDELRER